MKGADLRGSPRKDPRISIRHRNPSPKRNRLHHKKQAAAGGGRGGGEANSHTLRGRATIGRRETAAGRSSGGLRRSLYIPPSIKKSQSGVSVNEPSSGTTRGAP